jgi:hypothetical protein
MRLLCRPLAWPYHTMTAVLCVCAALLVLGHVLRRVHLSHALPLAMVPALSSICQVGSSRLKGRVRAELLATQAVVSSLILGEREALLVSCTRRLLPVLFVWAYAMCAYSVRIDLVHKVGALQIRSSRSPSHWHCF